MEQATVAPVSNDGGAPKEESNRWSTDRRKEALARGVAAQVAQGGRRVESQSDYNALLVAGKPVNHVLHGVLTFLTVGFWAFIWVPLYFMGGEKREMVAVDEYGNTSVQKL